MTDSTMFEEAFGTSDLDLYKDVLKVAKDCTPSQLRKGYYKQALKFHPDKNKSREAKLKFQAISWAYSLLKDPNKRKQYDEDGVIPFDDDDDETNEQSKKSWKDYFDLIFGKVSTDDIDSFARKYKMSDEEEKDVLENYVKFKGNVKKMLEFVMLSEETDIARWLEDYIQPAIEQNKVEDFTKTLEKTRLQVEKKGKKKTTKKSEKVHNHDPDETETEDSESDHDADVKNSKESGLASKAQKGKKKAARKAKSTKPKTKSKGSSDDLIAAIRNKKGRGNPLASIAARYGVSAMEEDPLNDAEFAKLQSKYAKK
mmetsp:Transcript_8290/g.17186  ORF Transcript_8290/g.17186 Transcript_8290/m.17186 type:complete len:313 (-) Transcript_8290:964-1902(-)